MPEMIPDYYYRKRGHIMGFTKKTWKNRIAEYINRRLITMEDGSTNLVTVARDEGTISQEGDAFNAANMNDLEDRIEAGFADVSQSLSDLIKRKAYHINNAKINANSGYNVTIDNISGYTPMGAFYDCTSGETTTSPTCPRRKRAAGVIQCQIINQYSSAVTTSGDLYIYYINQSI